MQQLLRPTSHPVFDANGTTKYVLVSHCTTDGLPETHIMFNGSSKGGPCMAGGDQLRLPWTVRGDQFWRGTIDGVTDPGSACVNCLYSCHILCLWHTFLMGHTRPGGTGRVGRVMTRPKFWPITAQMNARRLTKTYTLSLPLKPNSVALASPKEGVAPRLAHAH